MDDSIRLLTHVFLLLADVNRWSVIVSVLYTSSDYQPAGNKQKRKFFRGASQRIAPLQSDSCYPRQRIIS